MTTEKLAERCSPKFFVRATHLTENYLALFGLIFLALLPTMEVIARKFFNTGIKNSTDLTYQLVLFLTFVGGAITSREGKHLALNLELNVKDRTKERLNVYNAIVGLVFTTAFAVASLSFSLNGFGRGERVSIFPLWIISLVMVFGYTLMAKRFTTPLPKRTGIRLLTAAGVLIGLLIALPPLTNILQTVFPSLAESVISLSSIGSSINLFVAGPVIILLILSAFVGVPLFVVLGGVGYMLFARTGQPLEIIPNEAYSMLLGHAMPAIPLFTFAGFILSESKAGERLVGLFRAIFAWFPGGLAVMAILVCAFFTTFTGASGVTILALGALLSFILIKGKYKEGFSHGLLTSSGSKGLLFPPSLPLIIYGVTAGVSIKKMFGGGILPGFLLVAAMIVYSIFHAKKNKVDKERFAVKKALIGVKEAIWEILLPVVVIGGYFGGLTTLVESGAIAVVYALIVEVFIHRDIKIRELPQVILKCMPIIGGVLTILALAKGLSYYLVDAEIPMMLTAWAESTIHSKYVFLLVLNLALIITGCLMDIFSAIMIVVPLIIPLGNLFGIHPVHLGIIFLANLELGYMTPPVGLNLFLASYRFNKPLNVIYRNVIPFMLIQLIVVLLITYIPFLTTAFLKFIN
jgi:tripartite ATP-independent transporter DctM subunit